MKLFTVKAYAELIGKSEKTVYKMIQNETVDAVRQDGKYRVSVDKNLLKVLDRTQKALEEAKAVLASMETTEKSKSSPKVEKSVVKKPVAKPKPKKATKPKPLKKSTKKPTLKKPLKKSTAKKR